MKRDPRITADKRTGRAARSTTFQNTWTVETWWDRSSLNFITMIYDTERNVRDVHDLSTLGDSDYAGNAISARSNHASALALVLKNYDTL